MGFCFLAHRSGSALQEAINWPRNFRRDARMNARKLWIAFGLFAITAFSRVSFAQGLNWEGQTGPLLTPFAYTAASPAARFGKPEVAFHYLNSGNVIGNDYQFSITEGFGNRFEAGFTQAFSSSGSSPLSILFANGFNELHGKFTVLRGPFNSKWVPAIAVGAIGRFGAQRVSYYTAPPSGGSVSQTNGDFYIVATKTITQVKVLPFVLSLGDKVTNASIFGVAGNAGNGSPSKLGQRWQGRLFGAAAFVVHGPARSALYLRGGSAAGAQVRSGMESLLTGLAGTPSLRTFRLRRAAFCAWFRS